MLIDDIRALPADVLATHDTAQIAAALGPVLHARSHMITERGVMSVLPVPEGDAFLSALESFAAATLPVGHPLAAYHGTIRRGIGWLKTAEGLDVGDPLSRMLLDTLAQAGVVSAASVATIKALAEVEVPIDEMDVRLACWSLDGEWRI